MNLVMFDIDGTLTATSGADERCFLQAMSDIFQAANIESNWSRYKNVTDEGIAAEAIEEYTGRPPTEADLCNTRKRFLELMEREASSRPDLFSEINGAGLMLEELDFTPNIAVSIATGGWRDSAAIKLRAAGLDLSHLPMASASDAVSREEIMTISEERASSTHGSVSFNSVVYVGDGVWDFRAARSLGYHFVGVGTGDKASKLQSEGSIYVVPDFSDLQSFLGILETLWKNRF